MVRHPGRAGSDPREEPQRLPGAQGNPERSPLDFPKMEVLAVWSKPGAHADYVCLEPWHGMPDMADATGRFEDKPFATILAPGEAWQAEFEAALIQDE